MDEHQLISDLADPRVAGYRNLRERDLRAEGLFICEGALLAERLMDSRFAVDSLLVSEDCQARFAPRLQGRAPLYVASAALLREIAGFDFHRGVLALGRRMALPGVAALVDGLIADGAAERTLRLVACPSTETAENLGLIYRSAAAFGVDGVLLPKGGADPLSRRCLRQSMGAALSLPMAVSADLLGELAKLHASAGLELVATVAGDGAGVVSLDEFVAPRRAVLVAGHEFRGLPPEWLEVCQHHVTIPIEAGCDSLNVAMATAIFLYQMRV